MSRFRLHAPCRPLAACAIVAAATTLSVAIVLPAQLAPLAGAPFIVASSATPVTIMPGRIEVVAVRPHVATASALERKPAARTQG